MKYLSHAARLQCAHGGTVRPKPAVGRSLRINGQPILTVGDLEGATITGCPQSGPGIKPCLTVQKVMAGMGRGVTADGQMPLLQSVQALTDGVPPGICSAVDDGGSVMQIAAPVAPAQAAGQPPEQGPGEKEDSAAHEGTAKPKRAPYPIFVVKMLRPRAGTRPPEGRWLYASRSAGVVVDVQDLPRKEYAALKDPNRDPAERRGRERQMILASVSRVAGTRERGAFRMLDLGWSFQGGAEGPTPAKKDASVVISKTLTLPDDPVAFLEEELADLDERIERAAPGSPDRKRLTREREAVQASLARLRRPAAQSSAPKPDAGPSGAEFIFNDDGTYWRIEPDGTARLLDPSGEPAEWMMVGGERVRVAPGEVIEVTGKAPKEHVPPKETGLLEEVWDRVSTGAEVVAHHTVGLVKGVASSAVETAEGACTLVVGMVKVSSPLYRLIDPEGAEKATETFRQAVTAIASDPSLLVKAVVEPITTAWKKGEYGEAFGRGAFEVASVLLGPKGADKAAKGGKLADVAADVGRAAGKLDDAARLGDQLSDAAKAAGKLGDEVDAAKAADAAASSSKELDNAAHIPKMPSPLTEAEAVAKGLISAEDVAKMRHMVAELRKSLPEGVERDRSVFAVGLVKIDGEPRFVVSVVRNKYSKTKRTGRPHQIRERIDELQAEYVEAEPRQRTRSKAERAKAGAPEDAEQLLMEAAFTNNYDEVIAIMPSIEACPACVAEAAAEGILLLRYK